MLSVEEFPYWNTKMFWNHKCKSLWRTYGQDDRAI